MAYFMRSLLASGLFFITVQAVAQPSLAKMQQKLASEKQNTSQSFYKFELNGKMPTQAGIFFSPDMAVQKTNLQAWLADKLALRQGVDAFRQIQPTAAYAGTQISKLQQYYKGIKIEHGVISEVDRADKVVLLQMEFYPVPDNLPTVPILSESAALQKAISYSGAEKYVWDHNPNHNPDWNLPHGELVIVEDMFQGGGKMCLAYKFNVYALKPESRQLIYVDVITGKVVFKDAVIKNCHHPERKFAGSSNTNAPGAVPDFNSFKYNPNLFSGFGNRNSSSVNNNAFGVADTRYSGQRTLFTSPNGFGEYELNANAIGDNTFVTTLNCLNQPDVTLASPVKDNDNVWTSAEFPNNINMALDAHWGMEKTVEYWWKVHGRKSYDNTNGNVYAYTFYRSDFNTLYDNAKWDGNAFFFGEGGYAPDNHKPWTPIDLVAHEFGHAVCEHTANLVYERESGALNEGFSDIWGACLKNFIADTILPLVKKQWVIGDEIAYGTDIGLRSMENPLLKQDPDTYLDKPRKWEEASVSGCPIPTGGPGGNDNCGVHTNSGVLNKWFYLLTNGGTGLNGNYFLFTVDPFGFAKTEKIAFYTEQILTPNSGFEAARIASQNAVLILASVPNTLGITASDTINLKKAWQAVGVINDTVFKKSNTPVFETDTFTTVGIGKYGAIWAGTSNKGMYRYNGKGWEKAPNLTNHNISDIKADFEGRLWVAQFGRTGAQAIGGGLSCYPDSAFASYKYYSVGNGTSTSGEGLPTRNIRSLYINNRLIFDTFKRVWAAAFADLEIGNSRPGAVVRGNPNETTFDFNYKEFKKITRGVNQNFGFCQTIGGSDTEVWVFASNNSSTGGNQLLRYNVVDTSFIGFVDNTNSTLPLNFNAKSIYYDSVGKRWWVGMLSGGVYVYNTLAPGWLQVNFSNIFPSGTIVNNNAITGDTKGNIYIGTSKGLIYFGSSSSSAVLNPLDSTLYTKYNLSNGFIADNVKSIAVDYRASRIIVATDSGIAFKYSLCKECINKLPVYSVAAGNWNNPACWPDGRLPEENDVVIIRHPIVITQNTNVKSLRVIPPGSITVNSGVQFNVQGVKYETEGW